MKTKQIILTIWCLIVFIPLAKGQFDTVVYEGVQRLVYPHPQQADKPNTLLLTILTTSDEYDYFDRNTRSITKLENGHWVQYYGGSRRVAKAFEIFNGFPRGKCRTFHPNGQLQEEGSFSMDSARYIGVWRHYNTEGQVENEVVFGEEGRIPISSRKFYPSGQLEQKATYGDGTGAGWDFVTYYENGQVKEKATYNRFENRVGEYVAYHSNGQAKEIGLYSKNGKKEGVWLSYHANGQPRSEERYQEGYPIGFLLQWDEQGNKIKEISFNHGKTHIYHHDSTAQEYRLKSNYDGVSTSAEYDFYWTDSLQGIVRYRTFSTATGWGGIMGGCTGNYQRPYVAFAHWEKIGDLIYITAADSVKPYENIYRTPANNKEKMTVEFMNKNGKPLKYTSIGLFENEQDTQPYLITKTDREGRVFVESKRALYINLMYLYRVTSKKSLLKITDNSQPITVKVVVTDPAYYLASHDGSISESIPSQVWVLKEDGLHHLQTDRLIGR